MGREIALSTLALALALASCKPSSAAAGDAGAARAHGDSGPMEGGTTAIAPPDAGASDDGTLPAASSDELTLRARHLFEAIVQDNPDLGSDIVFPRDAFALAHDAADPGKVWDAKVAPSFRRAVHTLHKRTKGIERAQFVSFEIGRTVTQATPRHREWRLPLWRVPHARLTFLLDGRTERFDVNDLAAWRGAWYVSKLR